MVIIIKNVNYFDEKCYTCMRKKGIKHLRGDIMKDKLKKNRNLLTLILDILGIVIGYIIALIFLDTLELNIVLVLKGIAIYILVYQMYFNVLGLYQNMVELVY